MLCYGPLVSELGAQSAWCPQPRHWGPVPPPPAPPPMPVFSILNHREMLGVGSDWNSKDSLPGIDTVIVSKQVE